MAIEKLKIPQELVAIEMKEISIDSKKAQFYGIVISIPNSVGYLFK